MAVLVETSVGDFVIDLFTDERPRTCMNFLKLCKLKYYNFNLFHSIEPNFIAQTGDPTGSGRGGESIFSKMYGEQARFFEMESIPKLKHLKRGTVSMTNNGERMHGSQFFITLAENLDYLDGTHTVFGEISEGALTLTKLNEAICDDQNRPYKDIRITHTIVLDDPFDDPSELRFPSRSPSPTADLLKSSRIGIDETLDEMEGKDANEVTELVERKEASARAQILEMVGDLHHADERPPDNVLFVCKLNAVTTEDDLEVIFSRFGPVVECEVIRDRKTGSSLQYAFIEFGQPEHCENAYFKMDNVLIDDRRIHVDFSQSVSKNKGVVWERRGPQAGSKAPLPAKQATQASSSAHLSSGVRETATSKRREASPRSHGHERDRSPQRQRNDDDERRRRNGDDERRRHARQTDRHRRTTDERD